MPGATEAMAFTDSYKTYGLPGWNEVIEVYVKSEGSGRVVSPGSSRGYEVGAASSLDVLENFLIFSRGELEHLCVESPGSAPYILFLYCSDQLKPQPLANSAP